MHESRLPVGGARAYSNPLPASDFELYLGPMPRRLVPVQRVSLRSLLCLKICLVAASLYEAIGIFADALCRFSPRVEPGKGDHWIFIVAAGTRRTRFDANL
jgi:hypothetical protein